MSELDPQAKDLIGLAREGEGPTQAERSRLRGAVLARVGAGAAVLSATAGTASATTTAAGGGMARSFAAKVVVAIALVGAAGAGGYVTIGQVTKVASGAARVSRPAAAPGTVQVVGPAVPPPPMAPGVQSPRESPTGSEMRSEDTRAAAAPASPSLAAARPVSIARAPDTSTGPTTTDRAAAALPDRSLDDETRALRSVIADLRDGHADRALAAIDAQESRFTGGALAEERAEARIVTLCALGRNDEARADASRFLRAHPRSLLAGRVLASCGGNGAAGPSPGP
ncbi:MAG: hypothetical protein ACLP1X_29320 [Polyangiaceae bacterium]